MPSSSAETGLVCACTHYLVFKEPTTQSALGALPHARVGIDSVFRVVAAGLPDRVQGNLLRLLSLLSLVNHFLPRCETFSEAVSISVVA